MTWAWRHSLFITACYVLYSTHRLCSRADSKFQKEVLNTTTQTQYRAKKQQVKLSWETVSQWLATVVLCTHYCHLKGPKSEIRHIYVKTVTFTTLWRCLWVNNLLTQSCCPCCLCILVTPSQRHHPTYVMLPGLALPV